MTNVVNAVVSVEELDTLNTSLAGFNGPADFSNDREALGYLLHEERLAYPVGMALGYDFFLGRDVATGGFSSQRVKIPKLSILDKNRMFVQPADMTNLTATDIVVVVTALNWDRCGRGEDAQISALMRGVLVARGVLFRMPDPTNRSTFTKDTRCVFEDETEQVEFGVIGAIPTDRWRAVLSLIMSTKGKTLIRNWVALAIPVDYVFMARTHHFVGNDNALAIQIQQRANEDAGYYSYGQLYRAIWRSAFPEIDFPVGDAKVLFRTALHPFGVNTFRKLEKIYRVETKLPSGMLARAHPSPAGTAKITTGAAILRMLDGSPMFLHMRSGIRAATQFIHEAASRIKASPEHYHQNSLLYGEAPLTDDEKRMVAEATSQVNALAPLLVGFVTVECAGAPIAAQKTLLKPANDQAGLLSRVKKLFQNFDAMVENEDPQVALNKMLSFSMPGYQVPNFPQLGAPLPNPQLSEQQVPQPQIGLPPAPNVQPTATHVPAPPAANPNVNLPPAPATKPAKQGQTAPTS